MAFTVTAKPFSKFASAFKMPVSASKETPSGSSAGSVISTLNPSPSASLKSVLRSALIPPAVSPKTAGSPS